MKTLKFYLSDCNKKGYALGAYNFTNLETLKGICEGCKLSNSPALLALSESGLKYFGENLVIPVIEVIKKEYKLPLFLHLDHGKTFEICKKAIDLGFDSVMFDGSSLPFEENIKLTKKVVDFAHKKGVLVEGELGVLAGVEDVVKADKHIFTDPQKAKEFVEKTNCDSLAVAVGTSHGAYKYKGEGTIRFDVLEEIENTIPNTPLVLHGASSVPQNFVKTINENGGNLVGAIGTPEKILAKAAQQHNIYKINTDTDIRLCTIATVRKNFNEKPNNIDMRTPLAIAIEEIAKLVANKNETIFNCKDRA